jgi:hypothetical protein
MSEYYKVGGLETLNIIKAKLSREQYKGFLIGNVIKYLCRHEHKGSKIDDINKAIDYLGMYRDAVAQDDAK